MSWIKKIKSSLTLQILVAVILGLTLGLLFPGAALKSLTEFGRVIIQWVKVLAGPFLFVTVLLAFLQVEVEWKHGRRLIVIALVNTGIAIALGIGLSHYFMQGTQLADLKMASTSAVVNPQVELSMSAWFKTFSPQSLLDPFAKNEILLIALFGLLLGLALKKSFSTTEPHVLHATSRFLDSAKKVLTVLLTWVVHIIPLAVFAVIAGAVSEYGVGVFQILFKYVCVVFLGFFLQVILVYGYWVGVRSKITLKEFFLKAKDPLLYCIGVNSSLATLPLTLSALKSLGVSDRSASLGAGVATNLNNDGIVLYEASAVFFIAMLYGIPMDPFQMVGVALTCIVASMGITGIPEAGFISLSVILGVLHFPTEALPLLLSVDWIIARGRTMVNVLSDMTLAIAIDSEAS